MNKKQALWAPGRTWTIVRRGRFLPCVGVLTPHHPARSLVTIPFDILAPSYIYIYIYIYLCIWHSEDRASWYILIMKANEMHCSSHLFGKVLYMFRTCPLSIIRSISTLYTYNKHLSCWFCWRLLAWSGSILISLADATPDDGQWICPKHVECFIK